MSELSPLDHRILMAGGTTTTIERLPSQMQQAKAARQASLLKQNLDLVRENGRLRKEIAFYQGREQSLLSLFEKCVEVQDCLKEATQTASTDIARHEDRLLKNFGVEIDDAGKQDVSGI